MAKSLHVQIIGDARSYSRALGSATRETQTFGSKSGGVFRSVGRAAAFSAGSAGVGALTIALHAGIAEWTEGTRVAAQTAQVLKTTGGVANVTAKEVDALATAIQNKSGIDDEAIKTTENLLLGFTNIRNEVGKGNDIFTRATKIVTDYSVRTGKNASGAAIIFGKALQDPLKNMGALSRAVGGLSAAQKAQIKTMVESGNTIGAQKLLLAELEKRFGGAADAAGKTLPGQLDILRERFRNLAGQGVGVAIAKLQELAPTIIGAAKVIGSFMDVLAPLATLMFDVIVTPMKVIFALLQGDWAAAWDAAKKPVMDMVAVVEGVWNHLQGLVMPAVAAITGAVTSAWATIGSLTTSAWSSITGAITTALNTIASLTSTILGTISGIFTTAWSAVQTLTTSAWATITGAITTALTAISGAVTTAFGAMSTGVTSGMSAISGAMTTAWATIKGAAVAAWDAVVDAVRTALTTAIGVATTLGRAIMQGLLDGLKAVWQTVTGWLSSLPSFFRSLVGGAGGWLVDAGRRVMQGFLDGLVAGWQKVKDFVSGIGGWIADHKGPPSKDAVLLYPHGKLIIEGLGKGMTDAFKVLGSGLTRAVLASFKPMQTAAVRGMNDVGKLIVAAAKKYGVDARAALAVAMGEGGIKFGAVGDSGHAFGPFQFNNAGGVATGKSAAEASAWANSARGVADAIRMMADAGARGKTGLDAITAIVRNFERPLDPSGSIRKAAEAYRTLGPQIGAAIKSGAGAVTTSQRTILTGLVNLAKQYGPIIGIEQVRSIIRGLDASQPGFLAKAKEQMAAFAAAARQKVVESTATFASAFNGLANAALQAFDSRWAAWVPPAQRLLDKMQIAEQVKQVQDQLATAMTAISGGGAFDASVLSKQLGESLATAMSEALGSIAGAKTEEALNKVAAQVQTNVLAAIDETARTAMAQAQTAVDTARTALTAAQAGGDPDAILAAQTALDTAVGNQQKLEAAILAEKELALGQLVAAEQRRHDAIGVKQREGLAKQLEELKIFISKHPEEWAKLGPAVQAILGSYNTKLQTAGHAWADKFGDGIKAGIPYAVEQARALARAVAAVLPSTSSPLKPAKTGPLSFHPRTMGKAWATNFASGLASGQMGNIVGALVSGAPMPIAGGVAAAGAGGGATTINVYVTGSVTTEQELSEAIYRNLERRGRRNVSIFNR